MQVVISMLQLEQIRLRGTLILTRGRVLGDTRLIPHQTTLTLYETKQGTSIFPSRTITYSRPRQLTTSVRLRGAISTITNTTMGLTFSIFRPRLIRLIRIGRSMCLRDIRRYANSP